jgi:hypothetical protein
MAWSHFASIQIGPMSNSSCSPGGTILVFAGNKNSALRRNPAGWLMDGAFRYTLQFEEQRLDEDSGMAGLPGVSE